MFMALTLILFVWLIAITTTDLRVRRIPDILSLPLIALGLIVAVITSPAGMVGLVLADRLIGASAGYLIFAGIGAVFFRMRGQEGLGLGDAKLLAAVGAWLGWAALPAVVLIAALGGLAQIAVAMGILGRKNADRSLAFGPWLSVGFFVMWLLRDVSLAG